MSLQYLKNALRNLIYPGLDIHVRNRALFCRFWKSGLVDVLSAGSGNNYLFRLKYRSVASVPFLLCSQTAYLNNAWAIKPNWNL